MLETLAIGAIGGFLSGVGVYVVRQKRRADRLRRAFATEIRRSTPVGSFKAALMGPDSLKTPIIESNLNKLFLLNENEIRLVANYHRHMARVRNHNNRESRDDVVSIPSELQRHGGEIATETAETLESNILNLPKPIQWMRARYNGKRTDESLPTEEEVKEVRKSLIEKAEAKRGSGDASTKSE